MKPVQFDLKINPEALVTRVFDATGRCEQGISGKYEPELYPWR